MDGEVSICGEQNKDATMVVSEIMRIMKEGEASQRQWKRV